jgi:hypothetical protein
MLCVNCSSASIGKVPQTTDSEAELERGSARLLPTHSPATLPRRLSGSVATGADAQSSVENWITADTHLHSKGCGRNASPAELVNMMVEEGIDVGSGLIWGESWDSESTYLTGEDNRASVPGRILHYDLEISAFPAGQLGHLTLLGLKNGDFSPTPFSSPRSNLPIIHWGLSNTPRVVIGMSHGQAWPSDGSFPPWATSCCVPFEYPIEVAFGSSYFFEVEPALNWGANDRLPEELPFLWKSLLNTGLRIPLVGASDYPCLSARPGTARTHVLIEGYISYDALLEGIRRGRTTLAIGARDWLNLQINGARIGEEARVNADEALAITLESNLAQSEEVVLYANGSAVGQILVNPGPQTMTAQLTIPRSAWISARSSRVLTSPVYVLVDGLPVRPSPESACYFMRYIDYLTSTVTSRDALGEEEQEVLKSYAAARAVFEHRFQEGGGTACP